MVAMEIEGVLKKMIYRNEENGFAVLVMKNGDGVFTAAGKVYELQEGRHLRLFGEMKEHPRYGEQFAFESYEEILPTKEDDIILYLSGGFVKGIREKSARQIVEHFGAETFHVLENEPERLHELSGFGKKRVEMIHESFIAHKKMMDLAIFLRSHDVPVSCVLKLYKVYKENSLAMIRENPYRLVTEVEGIGFFKADAIAMKLGFAKDDPRRRQFAILHILQEASEQGHCFLYENTLAYRAAKLLGLPWDGDDPTYQKMFEDKKLVREEGGRIYLKSFLKAEQGTAERLMTVLCEKECLEVSFEENHEIAYDEIQMQAIQTAYSQKVMILTGGPGTGKTTVVKGILKAFEKADARIILCAPTGRAAKRLSEATGRPAKTIHRTLEYTPDNMFGRNAEAKLVADVVIADECSMIDIFLMHALLAALPDTARLILVGDADQLPSVGPGNVLKDLIDCNMIPVIRLQKIFRSDPLSMINTNAQLIRNGSLPVLANGRAKDFFFLEETDGEKAAELICSLVKERLPAYFKVSANEIQVLTPMHKGVIGTDHLNEMLQEALNPQNSEAKGRFRVRDRVMQTRNNYELEVYNGDSGIVTAIDEEENGLTVDYDGQEVDYNALDQSELVQAYAITVHKSQGSEYPVVVMPVMMAHRIMLKRNLLYTGITRAKKGVVLVGTVDALQTAVSDGSVAVRNTMLAARVRRAGYDDWRKKDLLERIAASGFRSKFHLDDKDLALIEEKGEDTIRRHAEEIIAKRLAPALIPNDGKQTPMKGHPVFKAQHATATCCRGCLQRWHGIAPGRELTAEEQKQVVDMIMRWIASQQPQPNEKNA